MPHLFPVVIPGGRGLVGSSLGFHAYSLRIDNCTNQWLQEETSLAWIPPYSLGTCLRLYGTAVAVIVNGAPTGQAQPVPIAGEYASGFYSDELRTEVGGTPIRQFALVQAVSDLTQGAEPAFPPIGTDRLWADSQGNIHHLHSDGTDYILADAHNVSTVLYPTMDPHYQAMIGATALGGDLAGTVSNGHVLLAYNSNIQTKDSGGTARGLLGLASDNNTYLVDAGAGLLKFMNQANTLELGHFDNSGNFAVYNAEQIGGALTVNTLRGTNQGAVIMRAAAAGNDAQIFAESGNIYAWFTNSAGTLAVQTNGGAAWIPISSGSHSVQGDVTASNRVAAGGMVAVSAGDMSANRGNGTGFIYFGGANQYLGFDGTQLMLGPGFGTASSANGGGPATIPGGGAAMFLKVVWNGTIYKIPMYYA